MMAASSTHHLATQRYHNFNFNESYVNSVSPVWTASVSDEAGSDNGVWEETDNLSPEQRIGECLRLFHKGRYLVVRHLPHDVTEEVSESYKFKNHQRGEQRNRPTKKSHECNSLALMFSGRVMGR